MRSLFRSRLDAGFSLIRGAVVQPDRRPGGHLLDILRVLGLRSRSASLLAARGGASAWHRPEAAMHVPRGWPEGSGRGRADPYAGVKAATRGRARPSGCTCRPVRPEATTRRPQAKSACGRYYQRGGVDKCGANARVAGAPELPCPPVLRGSASGDAAMTATFAWPTCSAAGGVRAEDQGS